MSVIKYPTPYLKNRRVSLGLTQQQVASAIGVEFWAMQKLEQRGEMPEIHFEKLAAVLKVSVTDLYIEKYAPAIREVFQIPTVIFREWIKSNLGTDRAFGRRPASIPTARSTEKTVGSMPDIHKKVLRHVRSLSPEEGFEELKESGMYTSDGKLATEYGGPKK